MKNAYFPSKLKYKILEEARLNGNVTETCNKYGISRTVYYKWNKRFNLLGMEGLQDVKRTKRKKSLNKIDLEYYIMSYVLKKPEYGARRIFYALDEEGFIVSESSIYNFLKEKGLNSKELRLSYVKREKVKDVGPHSVRKVENILRFSGKEAGYAILQRTLFLGKNKHLKNIYITLSIDLYSLYMVGTISETRTTECIIKHTERRLLPTYRSFGVPIKNIITDSSLAYASHWQGSVHEYYQYLKKNGIIQRVMLRKNIEALKVTEENILLVKDRLLQNIFQLTKDYGFDELDIELEFILREYNNNFLHLHGKTKGKTPTKLLYAANQEKTPLPLWVELLDLSSSSGKQ
ncbi:helix-turn-helix domain-containing protein [Fundicoccus culcitae]|uniref:Integrase catalytic domain-containing protein n=1 Tax=Fundicoccus culcitae TaxID=2969821 RepID=A0ABY5P7J5_9LACT|nr:helix-turn-helix domain-containing protein [Fundicoccus culcitae]UUX34706.1 hypothetical protein NRE15_03380 [Fundicoccus culcitae]